jgi:hypothetical protein
MTTDTTNEVPETVTDEVPAIDHTLYVLRDSVFLKGQEITQRNGWCGTAYDAMREMGIQGIRPISPQDLPVGTVTITMGGYDTKVYVKTDINAWEGTAASGFSRGTVCYPDRVRVPLTDEQMADIGFNVTFRPDGNYEAKAATPASTDPRDYILKTVVRRIALRYARAHTDREMVIVAQALTDLAIEAPAPVTAKTLPVTSVVAYRTRYNEHYTIVKTGEDAWESTSHEVFDTNGDLAEEGNARVQLDDSDVNNLNYYVVFTPQGNYQD